MRMRNYKLQNIDGGEISRVQEPFPPDLAPVDPEPARKTLTVSELSSKIKECMEGTFPYSVYVEGELSDPKIYPSGHLWFDLKDANATLKSVMWKESVRQMKFQPEHGLKVICCGKVEFYAPRGEVKFTVRSMEPKGMGALQLAFEQLKEKLQAEGLFADERKRPLPVFPQRVGLVTSPQGAAIDDMLRILRGEVEVLLRPTRVQGDGAAESIARGIGELNRLGNLDLLLVGRGGGSLEDLWAFNEEVLARAIAASELPVISAVGHEKDWCIADLVADARATTPTKGAEMVLALRRGCLDRLAAVLEQPEFTQPEQWLLELTESVADLETALAQGLQQPLISAAHKLQLLQQELIACSPQSFLLQQADCLLRLTGTMNDAVQHSLRENCDRLHGLAGRLNALSPLAVLERGYSITFGENGHILKEASKVKPGDRIETRLHKGRITARVEKISEGE